MGIIVDVPKRKTSPILAKLAEYWLPPIVWAGIIYSFSSIPMSGTTQIYWRDFLFKKTAHVVEYAVLAGLLYRALKESGMDKISAGYTAILICLFYGATDELHQSITPGRQPKARDIFFDTIGAVFAIYSIWNLLPKAPKRLFSLAKRLELL